MRAAHYRDTLPEAVGAFARAGRGCKIKVDIVGDHEIEVAVAVVVDEGAAGAPGFAGARDAGFVADFGEGCGTAHFFRSR